MANMVVGLIAVVMMVLFLGNYALSLNSIALWIIILGVLVMVVADFWQSLRSNSSDDRSSTTHDKG